MTLVETIKSNARATRWCGIALFVAGILALLSPLYAGLSLTIIVGALLLVGGASQLILVFQAGSVGEGILMLLLGVLWLIAGGYFVSQPVSALAAMTLFLAAYFIATGIIEIIGAFGARPQAGWGWLLFSGIVSAVLGVMIWRQYPLSGAWAVGILFGVRMIMSGSALMAIGAAVKEAAVQAEASIAAEDRAVTEEATIETPPAEPDPDRQ